MRSGRRIAIDVGSVRIGVAASDADGLFSSGHSTLKRESDINQTIFNLAKIVSEIEPLEIYIGLPLSLSGLATASTKDALAFGRALFAVVPIPIRFIDERLTTVSATQALRSSGKNSKTGRAIVDQIAATIILELALEIEKSTHLPPGKNIEELDE